MIPEYDPRPNSENAIQELCEIGKHHMNTEQRDTDDCYHVASLGFCPFKQRDNPFLEMDKEQLIKQFVTYLRHEAEHSHIQIAVHLIEAWDTKQRDTSHLSTPESTTGYRDQKDSGTTTWPTIQQQIDYWEQRDIGGNEIPDRIAANEDRYQ